MERGTLPGTTAMTENSLANPTGEKSVLDKWRIFLCLSILIAIFGAGVGIRVIGSLPIPQPMNVDAQGLILDRRDIPIATLTPEKNYIPITLEQISPVAVDALMVAVDPNFLTSNYEFGELVRASWKDLQGSNGLNHLTLSQQYLRLVNGNDDLSGWRKVREAASILRIQRTLSKEEILERYINVIPFGRESFGVEAGAQAWFGVSASNLDVDQAVYLAALFLVARDHENVELAEIHAGKILFGMLEQGHITEAEFLKVQASSLSEMTIFEKIVSPLILIDSSFGLANAVNFAKSSIIEELGERKSLTSTLFIKTTIDLEIQKIVASTVKRLREEQTQDFDVGVVVLDDQGHVRSMFTTSDILSGLMEKELPRIEIIGALDKLVTGMPKEFYLYDEYLSLVQGTEAVSIFANDGQFRRKKILMEWDDGEKITFAPRSDWSTVSTSVLVEDALKFLELSSSVAVGTGSDSRLPQIFGILGSDSNVQKEWAIGFNERYSMGVITVPRNSGKDKNQESCCAALVFDQIFGEFNRDQ